MGQRDKNIKETRTASKMWVEHGQRAAELRSEGSLELRWGEKKDYSGEREQQRKRNKEASNRKGNEEKNWLEKVGWEAGVGEGSPQWLGETGTVLGQERVALQLAADRGFIPNRAAELCWLPGLWVRAAWALAPAVAPAPVPAPARARAPVPSLSPVLAPAPLSYWEPEVGGSYSLRRKTFSIATVGKDGDSSGGQRRGERRRKEKERILSPTAFFPAFPIWPRAFF